MVIYKSVHLPNVKHNQGSVPQFWRPEHVQQGIFSLGLWHHYDIVVIVGFDTQRIIRQRHAVKFGSFSEDTLRFFVLFVG